MQKLFFMILLCLPFVGIAQTQDVAKNAHQNAVNLFLQHHPNAKAVDLKKLQAEQKGMHEKGTCSTCAKKQKAQQTQTSVRAVKDLPTLQAEKQRLVQIISNLHSATNVDKTLVAKYATALRSIQRQIDIQKTIQNNQIKKTK